MAPTKPRTPTDTLPRVIRGGSWYYSSATVVRAACRINFTPKIRSDILGFRCALRGRASRA